MTNFEIIVENAIANEIFTEEEIENLLNDTGDIPLHTFKEWQRLGFSVKKGEKAKMTCYIWRFKNEKKKVKENDKEVIKQEIDESDESKFYKTKAFFFTAEQVEKRQAA